MGFKKAEKEELYKKASELFLQQKSPTEAAKILGVSRPTVYNMFKKFAEEKYESSDEKPVIEEIAEATISKDVEEKYPRMSKRQKRIVAQEAVNIFEAELVKVDGVRSKIPTTLQKLIKRIDDVAETEKDLYKLTNAFEKIAPFVMSKSEPDGDGKNQPQFFNNLFQLHLTNKQNGQS